METQNTTLSIAKAILRKVKVLAVRQDTSVSGLLTRTLEGLVRQEDAYAHARLRHLQLLDEGVDLGTAGTIATGRDELHDRV